MWIHGICVCCERSRAIDAEDGHCRPCGSGRCAHPDPDDVEEEEDDPEGDEAEDIDEDDCESDEE